VQGASDQGNASNKQVGCLKKREEASKNPRDQLLLSPIYRRPRPRLSKADNIEVPRWNAPPARACRAQQIPKRLRPDRTSERSVRIARAGLVTLLGQGARLERALSPMLDLHGRRGYGVMRRSC